MNFDEAQFPPEEGYLPWEQPGFDDPGKVRNTRINQNLTPLPEIGPN